MLLFGNIVKVLLDLNCSKKYFFELFMESLNDLFLVIVKFVDGMEI